MVGACNGWRMRLRSGDSAWPEALLPTLNSECSIPGYSTFRHLEFFAAPAEIKESQPGDSEWLREGEDERGHTIGGVDRESDQNQQSQGDDDAWRASNEGQY